MGFFDNLLREEVVYINACLVKYIENGLRKEKNIEIFKTNLLAIVNHSHKKFEEVINNFYKYKNCGDLSELKENDFEKIEAFIKKILFDYLSLSDFCVVSLNIRYQIIHNFDELTNLANSINSEVYVFTNFLHWIYANKTSLSKKIKEKFNNFVNRKKVLEIENLELKSRNRNFFKGNVEILISRNREKLQLERQIKQLQQELLTQQAVIQSIQEPNHCILLFKAVVSKKNGIVSDGDNLIFYNLIADLYERYLEQNNKNAELSEIIDFKDLSSDYNNELLVIMYLSDIESNSFCDYFMSALQATFNIIDEIYTEFIDNYDEWYSCPVPVIPSVYQQNSLTPIIVTQTVGNA